jgi:Flp pilus assembly protein TadD
VTWRRAALAAVALSLAACAGPAVKPAELRGWHSIAAGDVRLIVEGTAREAEAYAGDLAGFDAAFAHLIGRKLASQTPTAIHLIRNRELGERLWLGNGVAGWALGTLEESLSAVLVRSKVETRLTLFHEYTHLLLARQRESRIPRWYNEGLAEYFSTLSVRDGAVVVGSVPFANLQWLATRGPMPLEELFETLEGARARDVQDFYATSWALIHYLLGTPRGRTELSRFDKELAAGVPVDTARERAFGRSFTALTAELTAHIGYLRRGVSAAVVLDPRQIRIAKPVRSVPLAPAQAAWSLGFLALSLGDQGYEENSHEPLAASRALLAAAVDGDPSDARARASLAYVQALSRDEDDARAGVARALADAPAEPEVLWRAGQAALALGDATEAEKRLREALAIDAEFASAWFGLGRALDQRGDAGAALDALEHARRLAWSSALDLETGRLYLAAGRSEDALALLQPLAADPHGGQLAKQAAELLREAGLEAQAGAPPRND